MTMRKKSPNNSPRSPLSIYYQPEYPIKHGWGEQSKCMAEILQSLDPDPASAIEHNTLLNDTLLALFVNDKPFREAVLAEKGEPLYPDVLQLEKLYPIIAQIYFVQISIFRCTVIDLVNTSSVEFLKLFGDNLDSEQKLSNSQELRIKGPTCMFLKQISNFNKHKDKLAKAFLTWYKSGKLTPTTFTGRADLVTPVTFLGFSGKYAVDQSFSLCPDTFKGGYIVIRCENWGGERDEPVLIEESCSGVKQVAVKDNTVILAIDDTQKKTSGILIGDTIMPASQTGQHVVTISEAGEFQLEIYYRQSLDAPKTEDIPLFAYEFCCK